MAYIWGMLAAIQPAFRTVTDSSDAGDPGADEDAGDDRRRRASLLLVVYALRDRPWLGPGRVRRPSSSPRRDRRQRLVGPVRVDLPVLRAGRGVLCAISGHNGFAAALLAVAIMTKPQALPFLVPFAAWFWATGGIARVRAGGADRDGRRRRPVAAVHRRRTGRPTTCTTSPYTRATSSTSSRSAPGTCGGSSRRCSPAGSSWRTTIAFIGPVTLRWVGCMRSRASSLLVVVRPGRPPTRSRGR